MLKKKKKAIRINEIRLKLILKNRTKNKKMVGNPLNVPMETGQILPVERYC